MIRKIIEVCPWKALSKKGCNFVENIHFEGALNTLLNCKMVISYYTRSFFAHLSPVFSTHSKPCTRVLKRFVLQHSAV